MSHSERDQEVLSFFSTFLSSPQPRNAPRPAGRGHLRSFLHWWLRPGFNPWVGKILWRKEWLPTPVFLPGEFHGQRNLAGYSP